MLTYKKDAKEKPEVVPRVYENSKGKLYRTMLAEDELYGVYTRVPTGRWLAVRSIPHLADRAAAEEMLYNYAIKHNLTEVRK